jgi:hypothetical protein
MLIENLGDLLHIGPRPLRRIHFEQRLEDCELLNGCLPFLRRDGHEVRYGSSALVKRMIGLRLRNRDPLEFSPPNFPRNDGVEPSAVHDHKAPLPPTNDSTWCEAD